MEFRLARIEDLKQLKIIYKEIIKNMNKNNIEQNRCAMACQGCGIAIFCFL